MTSVLADESVSGDGDLYIRSVCFSPDGKFIATGAEDRQIRVGDIYSLSLLDLVDLTARIDLGSFSKTNSHSIARTHTGYLLAGLFV
jgi:WD40 repeat protein